MQKELMEQISQLNAHIAENSEQLANKLNPANTIAAFLSDREKLFEARGDALVNLAEILSQENQVFSAQAEEALASYQEITKHKLSPRLIAATRKEGKVHELLNDPVSAGQKYEIAGTLAKKVGDYQKHTIDHRESAYKVAASNFSKASDLYTILAKNLPDDPRNFNNLAQINRAAADYTTSLLNELIEVRNQVKERNLKKLALRASRLKRTPIRKAQSSSAKNR